MAEKGRGVIGETLGFLFRVAVVVGVIALLGAGIEHLAES